ncbi:MAG: hypothetical protein ACOC7L_00385, partial [Acidobacteriota bacterium]
AGAAPAAVPVTEEPEAFAAEPADEASTMDDQDFMAALSRAFEESERERGDAEGEEVEEGAGAVSDRVEE